MRNYLKVTYSCTIQKQKKSLKAYSILFLALLCTKKDSSLPMFSLNPDRAAIEQCVFTPY